MQKSIYVGCALIGSTDEYKKFINEVITILEKSGLKINRFFSFSGVKEDNTNIYLFDRQQVLNSSVLVAFVDFPSTGLGMEIEIATANNKEIIFVAKKGTKVSKMVSHLIRIEGFPFVLYERYVSDEVAEKIKSEINIVLIRNFY
jgi:hypothetical protein